MSIVKLNKPPKMLHPFVIEDLYRKALLNLVSGWENEVRRLVIPKLSGWLIESEMQRGDAWAEDINSVMNDLHLTIGAQTEDFLKTELPEISSKTNRWNEKEWTKVVNSVLGIDLVRQEPWLNDQIKSWIDENTNLIKDLQSTTEKRINNIVSQGILQGQRSKTIEKHLISKAKLKGIGVSPFDSTASAIRKARNRAKLIAEDQVGKLNSKLTERRQTDLGVKRYRWRNVNDIRVRGNPGGLYPDTTYNHWSRNGKIYSWDNPPPDGHPGWPVKCRCYAEPVFEDIVDMRNSTAKKKVLKPKPKIDKNLKTEKQIKNKFAVDEFEEVKLFADNIKNKKVEHLGLFNKNGKKLYETTQNKKYTVRLPDNIRTKGKILLHNHPIDVSFSASDLFSTIAQDLLQSEVISKSYKYKLSNVKKLSKKRKESIEFLNEFYDLYGQINKANIKKYQKMIDNGKISVAKANREIFHSINKEFAKQSGYFTYERKKI